MTDKGGLGFTLPPKTPKSSMKTTAGKDDGSGKKRGRRARFDDQAQGSPDLGNNFTSSKSNGSGFTLPSSKSNGKASNRGKTAVAKEQPLELRVEQEITENVKCMMDCEAADILRSIQVQMVQLSADPNIKLPDSFDMGLQYAERENGSKYTDSSSVRQALEALAMYDVSNSEICVIANVCPESEDEVLALVPSLKSKRNNLSEPLKEALDELAKFKKGTE